MIAFIIEIKLTQGVDGLEIDIQAFLKMDVLPNDLRLGLMQDLMNSSNTSLKGVLADAELAKLFLSQAA
ncbi:hypothetical protein [Photobacterium sp. OFAV2-7]|uniref:hypothetical protein n=1 Tax=Photobacterium sp. OFAV2-7 TaxID=2917748 RepID=UPI001EF72EBB|nr:hypothetical protein [Photobacterium sp. OFAV2-7]MCG7588478.1 hypothetical protein [Photobacterium sp. OFAV2-7]